MKKRIPVVLLLAGLVGAHGFAQSLENNEYYKQSVEYAGLSQRALGNGQYTEAEEYAIKSQEYAALSRQYIERMRLAYRARSAWTAAKARMDKAGRMNLASRSQDLYREASLVFASATDELNAGEYEGSISDSRRVTEMLRDFEALFARTDTDLAAFYEVKLIPNRRDCLWRIAEYDFIYGDPYQWPHLYEANKDSFPDPQNPHWIEPGQILKVPSLKGEQRSGAR